MNTYSPPLLEKEDTEKLFKKIVEISKSYLTDFDESKLNKAYNHAKKGHSHQARKNEDPFILHPLTVALYITEYKADQDTLIAAILHDLVLEDVTKNLQEIHNQFGPKIARMVEAINKLRELSKKTRYNNKTEIKAASLQKMINITAHDPNIALIKLLDRLHNIQTINALRPDKRRSIIEETLNLYVPLASLLGLWRLKNAIEELCFEQLHPSEFQLIQGYVFKNNSNMKDIMNEMIKKISEDLKTNNINSEVKYENESLYSIFQQMKNKKKNIEEIDQIYSIKIIVNSVNECYLALERLHQVWKTKQNTLRDYISVPKSNNYRAIHTKIYGPQGRIFLFKILTHDMEDEARLGIMHQYSEKDKKKEFHKWQEQLKVLQKQAKDPEKFLKYFKTEILQEKIFIYTTQGKIIDLPKNATSLDAAFAIEKKEALKLIEVEVNDKEVHLNTNLDSGDTVEIVKGNGELTASLKWLNYVKTSYAENLLKDFFANDSTEVKKNRGKNLLNQELKKFGKSSVKEFQSRRIKKTLNELNYPDIDSLYIACGEGKIQANKIIKSLLSKPKLIEKILKRFKNRWNQKKISEMIDFQQYKYLKPQVSECCQNINPPESIMGHAKEGNMFIHRKSCPQIKNKSNYELIEINWNQSTSSSNRRNIFEIKITRKNHPQILTQIYDVMINNSKSFVHKKMKTKNHNKIATDTMRIEVRSWDQINNLLEALEYIEGIQKIKRISLF